MRERHLRVSLVLSLVLLAAVPAATSTREAQASVAVAASIEDLARVSSVIARVTSLDRESSWEGGRIVTYSRVRVDDVVAGATPAAARELRVRTLGGQVGNVAQTVEGEAVLVPGASSVLFLAPRALATTSTTPTGEVVVMGRAQGQLLVRRDVHGREVVRLGAMGELVARAIHPPLRDTGRRIADLDGAALQTVAIAAKSAWEASHAR